MRIRDWIQRISRKRIDFIWTYSGWFDVYSVIAILCAIIFILFPRTLSIYTGVFLALICAAPLVDIVTVAIVDRRNPRDRSDRPDQT